MEIAALILSVIALLCSGGCLTIMLAKNYFSTHQVQMVPIDPFKDMMPTEMGRPQMDPLHEIPDFPLDQDEIDRLQNRKARF